MKIGIIGDIFMGYVNNHKINPTQILEEYQNSTILSELEKNDFNIGNLEAPITQSNNSIIKSGPAIKNPKEVIDFLKISNINCVALANNHIFDFGAKGLKQTIEICDQNNIKHVGAGLNENTIRQPSILEKNGIKTAIIAVAENEFNSIDLIEKHVGTNSLDLITIYEQIHYAKSIADYIIIIVHGGHEHYQCPSFNIRRVYRHFINLGANAVVAHHPHVVQSYEIYKECPIFYSLGNYFFPSEQIIMQNHEGYIVVFSFTKNDLTYEIIPYTQCVNNYNVSLLLGEQKQKFFSKLNKLSEIIKDDQKLHETWKKFVKEKENEYLKALFPFHRKITSKILKYRWLLKFLPKIYLIRLLNLVRCESHRDLLIHIIKSHIYNK